MAETVITAQTFRRIRLAKICRVAWSGSIAPPEAITRLRAGQGSLSYGPDQSALPSGSLRLCFMGMGRGFTRSCPRLARFRLPRQKHFLLELLRYWSNKKLCWQILDRNKTLLATH